MSNAGDGGDPSDPPTPAAVNAPASSNIARTGRVLMRAGLRAALIALALGLLALATFFAQRQAPHPDMFRPIGDWDITKAEWWAYPLERNSFKRRIVRGDLNAVFALPNAQKLWAVGSGGLILHSDDDGLTWAQQRPAIETPEPVGSGTRVGAAWSLLGEARAAEPPGSKQQAAQSAAPRPNANPANSSIFLNRNKPGGAPASAPSAPVMEQEVNPPQVPRLSDLPNPVAAPASSVRESVVKSTIAPQQTPAGAVKKGSTSALRATPPPATKASTPNPGPVAVRTPPLALPAYEAADLKAVFFLNERAGWAVGDDGTILATSNGGATWAAQTSGSKAGLTSVQFTSDGQRGWAVGIEGTILATSNGGATWAAQTSGSKAGLTSVQFTSDGQRGWAVGIEGTILATRNGGKAWSAASYQRFWPPWYFAALAFLALALFTLLGLVEPVKQGAAGKDDSEQAPGGAATLLRSDQPVADKQFDRLGVRPAVEALSSFIRNRETEPRVTIAVTGEWGNGKSSVMRMLQTELERAGFRSAWFNAWHHQQEGRQLSALFNVVRKQAVPGLWRQPFSALRVRSRLIWGRGAFYKAVSVATALTVALLLGDMLADGLGSAADRVRLSYTHYLLQQRQTAITGASLARLNPFAHPVASAASAASAASGSEKPASPAAAAAREDPCSDKAMLATTRKAEPVRPELYCYMKQNLQWDEGGDASHCGVQIAPEVDPARRCVFASAQDLIATLEKRGTGAARKLWPSEEKAVLAAAETLPPPPVFPWLEHSLLGGFAGLLLLLFGKGIAVYGVQITAPLRALLAAGTKEADGGKEASGTVERYRAEFSLLCDALGGRLVIFIDDLDRCTPDTVNGMLELTNYLVDVGQCFVVIGAAMDRVKRCVRLPETNAPDDVYATAYLRKLVHIELPVPQNRQLLENLASAEPTQLAGQAVRSNAKRLVWQGVLASGALTLLLLVFVVGQKLHEGSNGKALQVVEVAATPIEDPASAPIVVRPVPPKPLPVPADRRTAVGLDPTLTPTWPAEWLGVAALMALAGALWRWARHHRERVVIALGGAVRTEDSDRFMEALKIWNPVVVSPDPTPRHVKRFYNRARLFAAYEREDAAGAPTQDECLVALAAMHHLDPASLSSLATALAKTELDGRDAVTGIKEWLNEPDFEGWENQPSEAKSPERAVSDARKLALDRAWRLHLSTFGSAPSAVQVRRFAGRVEGILVR